MAPDAPPNDSGPGSIGGRAARWILTALLMLSAGYACWVIAGQVLWVLREREPLTLLTGLALGYVVVVVWTAVWVAITIWTVHSARRLYWLWVALVPLPGLVGVSLLTVLAWGGPLDAEFAKGIALVGALLVLEAAGLVGLQPRFAVVAARRLRALRHKGDTGRGAEA